MTDYSSVASFGGVYFKLAPVVAGQQQSTLKTNIGKKCIQKEIPMRNAKDRILEISGVITGLSQTAGQTQAQAIETDRTALIALDDGYFHAYNDGKHSGNFVIINDSLSWDDSSDRLAGQPYKFTMTLVEWQ